MNKTEIIEKLQELIELLNSEKYNRNEFIYDFLLAFGLPRATITRLKKGDYNHAEDKENVLLRRKIFFKTIKDENPILLLDSLTNDNSIKRFQSRFIMLTDYKKIYATDTKLKTNREFEIERLEEQVDFFIPLTGAEIYRVTKDTKADRDAAYKLGELYDLLVQENPEWVTKGSHNLNVFLARILFSFYAEDTGIFEQKDMFTESLANNTKADGSDTIEFLDQLFDVLNQKPNQRTTEHRYLDAFPYVNGGLFKEKIDLPTFSFKSRKLLIESGELDWSEINPDIFGSMIQAVADPEERTNLGMHYTSVENILKVIKPLFLDELTEEFEKNRENPRALEKLLHRISKMKFFDPACGSGNFLIITYKELRLLEIEIIQQLISISTQTQTYYTQVKLSQFYGIEIKDFAKEMAVLSLWLAEHQMNQDFMEKLDHFAEIQPILPLQEAGNIVLGNAARMNWEEVCPINKDDEVYVFGNPPYLGYSLQDKVQKQDRDIALSHLNSYKKLDYIAIWFIKASDYIKNTKNTFAFVSTNSITQGEQPSLLFPYILENNNQEIFFCHQSFRWTNHAKNNAGVSVVIIGVRESSSNKKLIFNDDLIKQVNNINPYLIDYKNIYIKPARKNLSNLPNMIIGSKITDNGNLLLEKEEYKVLLNKNQNIFPFIKKYIGAREFMNNTHRYCIHIEDDKVDAALSIKELKERFDKVREFRLKSKKKSTQKKAETPYFFDEDKYQEGEFILVPQTGSERRNYIPIGFFNDTFLPSNAVRVIYNAEPWIFGLLSSRMHICWVRTVAGRMKMDMQYSNTICYNTFPFPKISKTQKESLTQYVFDLLREREKHSEKTMAYLYDPDTMPEGLRNAHQALDEAVEQIYRLAPFHSDEERLEFLFREYEKLTKKDTLFAKRRKTNKRK